MIARTLRNTWQLGLKEFRSLYRDRTLLFLIAWAFTVGIYTAARAQPETLNAAPLAIVDEDQSQLSSRIVGAFYPPYFRSPEMVSMHEADRGLDSGNYTFSLDIPPHFERDVLAGRNPALQLNVDATRLSQALVGTGYVEAIVDREVMEFAKRQQLASTPQIDLVPRLMFNQIGSHVWFGSVMELINNVTLLSIVLAGAALIREREHGTVEHLLVMPLRPLEIMLAKVWSMGLVVLVTAALSLYLIVQGLLQVPISGSVPLFLAGTALHLFATTALGIFLGTVARSMPQFGLLMIMVLLPLQILSGGTTPRESMPDAVATLMLAAPTTHFVEMAQAILYRGAGLDVVWRPMLCILAIGGTFFGIALSRFRRSIADMQT
nr:ABC transporter permease [Peristeroidobacter soli]